MYYNTDKRATEEIVAAGAPFVRYERTDRNGTRYFYNCKCERCGGTGTIPHYGYVDNGICFECGGSGRSREHEVKVYTEAHAQKLEAAAQKRREKKEQEHKANLIAKRGEYLQNCGFGCEDGTYVIYRVIGNTYPIKDELKAAGAKFNGSVGWYFNQNNDEYRCQRMTEAEVLNDSIEIEWKEKKEIAPLFIENIEKPEIVSVHVGEIGERCAMELTFDRRFEGTFCVAGTSKITYTYFMHDKNGNQFKWRSANYYETDTTYNMNVTIKDHTDYKGTPVTVLTRCSKRSA